MASGSDVTIIPRLLTPKQAAARLGVQVFRIYECIRQQRLAVIRLGRTYRISEAAIAQFVEQESQPRGAR